MEESIYILHHQGLGDHILCNGIVRISAQNYKKVFVFVKPQYFLNVSFMFRDLINVFLIQMLPSDIKFFMQLNPQNKYLVLGFTPEYFRFINEGRQPLDVAFYHFANISLEEKWNSFKLIRDIEKEKNVFYNVLGLNDNDDYIFIHEDSTRNFILNRSYIPESKKRIRAEDFKNVGIFDFLYTIEKAKEVHVMASAFYCLIDTMQIQSNKLVLHDYANTAMGVDTIGEGSAGFIKYKLNWNRIC